MGPLFSPGAKIKVLAEWSEMTDPAHTRAAQYIRIFTDAQDLAPEIQAKAIEAYALVNGMTVVDTYFDAGRSGQPGPPQASSDEEIAEMSLPKGAPSPSSWSMT